MTIAKVAQMCRTFQRNRFAGDNAHGFSSEVSQTFSDTLGVMHPGREAQDAVAIVAFLHDFRTGGSHVVIGVECSLHVVADEL